MRLIRWISALFGRRGQSEGAKAPSPKPAWWKPEPTPPVHKYGGRGLRAIVEGTSERDHYVHRMSGRAGLRELVMLEGEEPERFARRVLDDLIDADVIHEVLGGLLIPAELQDHEWTPEIAAETARHLRKCHAAEEKARINAHILGYLQDFYSRAMGLLVISRTASGRARLEEARVRTIASGNGAN